MKLYRTALLSLVSLGVYIALLASLGGAVSLSQPLKDAILNRVARQEHAGHHHSSEHDHDTHQDGQEQTVTAPCHLESEVVEIFNQLVMELNISEPGANDSCFYVLDHHHEEGHNHTEHEEEGEHHDEEEHEDGDHHDEEEEEHSEEEEKRHDEEDEDHHEESFCGALYSLTRQMVLSLNYTTLSCLENGTVEAVVTTTVIRTRSDPALAYGLGCLVSVLLSLVSLLGVVTVPCLGKRVMNYLFSFLVAMGISALASDSVVHLIPHSFLVTGESGHAHDDRAHSAEFVVIWKGSIVLATIALFFVFEFVMKWWRDRSSVTCKCEKSKSPKTGVKPKQEPLFELATPPSYPTMHSVIAAGSLSSVSKATLSTPEAARKRRSTEAVSDLPNPGGDHCKECCLTSCSVPPPPSPDQCNEETEKYEPITTGDTARFLDPVSSNEHRHAQYNPDQGLFRGIVPVAWIIIIGDAFHNFIDGLAIGAAFASSTGGGLSTSLAILFHEVPHEFGDYAILLSTGMKWYIAAFYNLASAATAIVGVFVGVAVGNASELATTWIFGIAAGIFLYVALVDMLPSLYDNKYKGWQLWIHFSLNIVGFLIAYGVLVVLAVYEHQLETLIVI